MIDLVRLSLSALPSCDDVYGSPPSGVTIQVE